MKHMNVYYQSEARFCYHADAEDGEEWDGETKNGGADTATGDDQVTEKIFDINFEFEERV